MEEPPFPLVTIGLWLQILLVFGFSLFMLNRYVSFKKTAKYVYLPVALGFFLSFGILFLLPLDIGMTSYLQCRSSATDPESCNKPYDLVDPNTLKILWTVVYWTTFACTWLVYPLLQSFSYSGHFGFKNRVLGAIRENVIFYGVGALIFIVVLIWVYFSVTQHSFMDTLGIGIAISNAWGLLLLICFLGYGLCHVPRTIWRLANRPVQLKYIQFKLIGLKKDVDSSEEDLLKLLKKLKKLDESISSNHAFREYVDQMLKIVPDSYSKIRRGSGNVRNSYSAYVKFHTKLKSAIHNNEASKSMYNELLIKAIEIEDIVNAQATSYFTRPNFQFRKSGTCSPFFFNIEWIWILIQPITFRLLAILCALISVTLVYSETVFFLFPKYSIFALLVTATRETFWMQAFSFIGVSYIAACVFSGLFNLKLFNYYQLIPHQHTDENSILFSAAYLSRLLAPLALNFLYVINFVQREEYSDLSPFLRVMGPMSVVPFLGNNFQIYFPIAVFLFTFATLFNLGNKVLSLCRVKKFQFSEDYEDGRIDEGRALLSEERERMERGLIHSYENVSTKSTTGDIESQHFESDSEIFEYPEEKSIFSTFVGFFSGSKESYNTTNNSSKSSSEDFMWGNKGKEWEKNTSLVDDTQKLPWELSDD
eukprot:TRINITY_DN6433_c0_g1_i1.p1 TRINITY_DN6433_c0_g1~~TRINITY_DN6433_c0_g1_i1.p1  ORF type:complete len:669 (+),score=76.56 TRINITY_DN6433_c0_g1_i1:63-2009(+)